MNTIARFVEEAFCEQTHIGLPEEVMTIVERHRETLLNLAQALIASGRHENEVIAILQTASESFSSKLTSDIERALP